MQPVSSTSFHGKPNAAIKKCQKALNDAVEGGELTQSEKKLIQAYISEAGATRNITPNRKYAIALSLLTIRRFMPGAYGECTHEEIFTAVGRYRSESENKQSTQNVFLTAYKGFLKWLIATEKDQYLKLSRIEGIKTNNGTDLLSKKDILTGGELERIFRAMKNLKDRAFIEVLYESGGRINEVALLKWDQIEFIDNHAVLTVKSKTNKERKIPLHISSMVLKQWIHQYPHGVEPDKYVFYGRASAQYKGMSYNTAYRIVTDAAKEAGIAKHVHPHMLRHTRVTDLLRLGIPEQTIKMIIWGSVSSEMLKVYAHLTPTDAVNDMNMRMGIETGSNRGPLADVVCPMQCPRCCSINSKLHLFCGACGERLRKEAEGFLNATRVGIEETVFYKMIMEDVDARIRFDREVYGST